MSTSTVPRFVSFLALGAMLGVAPTAFGQDPDVKPYDGGDWRADRIRRGLVPDPTVADYEKAVAEWKASGAKRNEWGPTPDYGRPNAPVPVPATKIYVSPDGDDAGDGSAARPLRTAQAAQKLVRAKIKAGLPADGVAVVFRGGRYPVRATLALTAEDSGRPGRPVVWMAEPGEEMSFDGGVEIRDWKPVTDPAVLARIPESSRPFVRVADVRAAGAKNFREPGPRGFEADMENEATPVCDFYMDDIRQDLSLWPKQGWQRLVAGSRSNNTVRVDFPDWSRWVGETSLYVRMYPACYWSDLTTPVTALDPVAKTMTTYGKGRQRVQVTVKNQPFRFLNALAALERPGECVCDWTNGLVYAWFPSRGLWGGVKALFGRASEPRCAVSDFNRPFLSADGVTDVVFDRLAFRCGMSHALTLAKCERVTFRNCTFAGFGQRGVSGKELRNVTVDRCTFRDFGYIALRLGGGTRRTLEGSGIWVQNCEFSRSGNWMRDFAQAFCFDGCGANVRWNLFHDIPGAAVRLNGNDVLFASNIVERCDSECGDNSALDIYANPTYANRIIHNLWRDIGSGELGFAEAGQAAIRLDDAVSNQIIYGNRFVNCSPYGGQEWGFGCVNFNGGRNNLIENNLLCGWRGVSINAWPQKRWEKYMANPRVREEMDAVTPLYSTRYPGFAGLREMKFVNRLYRNVQIGTGRFMAHLGGLTDLKCNFAYRETPSEETLNANPLWEPLPPESALGPRPE